jgi:L-ascorbate metabolism protein UlaG (beta-lactamase superfamily)
LAQLDKPSRPGRRRALKWLGSLGLVGVGTAIGLSPRRANAYYSGPITDHFDGLVFRNPSGPGSKSLRELAKWQFGSRAEAWPNAFPSPFAGARPDAIVPTSQSRITLIGHASFLIQTGGLNILVDPVYVERASPVQFAGPKRVNAPGIAFDELPKIDVVLVTHNHYDHLDLATIGQLWQRFRPRIFAPLGNDTIMKTEIADLVATTLDWWQTINLGNGLKLDAVPTQHWSARGTRDRMHALWASFVLSGPSHVIYHVGDSGFGEGSYFREIGKRFPRIDFANLPIGAYEPRWFMRDQHMNPEDAVAALELCGAKRAAGHHWGTFKLTNEAIEAPREALATVLTAKSIPHERFPALQPGQAVPII